MRKSHSLKLRSVAWTAATLLALISCQRSNDEGDNADRGELDDDPAQTGTGGSRDKTLSSTGGGQTSTGAGGSVDPSTGGSATGGAAPLGGSAGMGGEGTGGTEPCAGMADGSYCGAELEGIPAPTDLVLCVGGMRLAQSPCIDGCSTLTNACFDPGGASSLGARGAQRIRDGECRQCKEVYDCGPESDACYSNQACVEALSCMDICPTQDCSDACVPAGGKGRTLLVALDACWWNECFPECTKEPLAWLGYRHPPTCVSCLESTCTGYDACLADASCNAVYECMESCTEDSCLVDCKAGLLKEASVPLWNAMEACGETCSDQGCWYGQDLSGVP